ncbi:KipI antagonist [Clostridium acetireducens DSM 10703]|jgi:antagonist of KipI|uniref:KipI antagonist n=1 Tax=Clostridium acetireducens DSM 10703 TaxID=1121290 RepID=A0A1E8F0L2_9CLOT|nr:biotin-dependent carboxyltransferase family protein [Clostridium acetireducens]OFI06958.1 KipI antagonist [Clostridium acetireducens DSM 10703]
MADLKIINAGLFTTIQDKGRIGYQQFGMSTAGAMDEFSLKVGNILLGNDEYEGALEITMVGPQIEFNTSTVIVITGANISPKLNNNSIPMWHSIKVKKGDVLSFGGAKSGCRSYICFAGGIDVPKVLGSKSTYVKAAIGGFKGRALKSGDEINLVKINKSLDHIANRTIPENFIPKYFKNHEIRLILGPQHESFSKEEIEKFLNSEYEISNQADRMGYRLSGPEIKHIKGADIISDGIALGSVQIPGHGMPIIMMADRQTTGGYTKIATIISTDIPVLGQAKPGDKIKFKNITIEEAHEVLRNYNNLFKNIKKSIYKKFLNIADENLFSDHNNDYYDVYYEKVFK